MNDNVSVIKKLPRVLALHGMAQKLTRHSTAHGLQRHRLGNAACDFEAYPALTWRLLDSESTRLLVVIARGSGS
uniref:Uncharacterized protein n=1 Tax=Picea glauca TaxID=3330 RepID=A0A101M273_PICGL|nr:hypothetical protein ABT39_MTgene2941 [Picea glauca]QHR86083.1 hypothetical protein Q903MT_gene81 [Picea sitchensis]